MEKYKQETLNNVILKIKEITFMNDKNKNYNNINNSLLILLQSIIQNEWKQFINTKNEKMNKYILDIYKETTNNKKVNNIKDIEDTFKSYIIECCEICWIMVLRRPKLIFYPKTFEETKNDNKIFQMNQFDNKYHKTDLDEDLIPKKIHYCIWPAIIKFNQKNKIDCEPMKKAIVFCGDNE